MNAIFYSGTQTQVLPGDHVQFKAWFFLKVQGIIVYVPGISPKNKELERNSHSLLAIEHGDRSIKAWPIFDGNSFAPPAIKFIGRSKGPFKEITQDEELT